MGYPVALVLQALKMVQVIVHQRDNLIPYYMVIGNPALAYTKKQSLYFKKTQDRLNATID